MSTITIGWLNKCRCGNKSHTVKTARGNETALWDDDTVKCNSCGRGGVIQVCEGQARVLWETDEEMAENKPMSTITKEFTKEQLQQIEAAAKEVLWPVVWSEKKAREHFSEKITAKVVLKLARIALASLETEPAIHRWRRVTVEPYGPYPWHYGNFIGFSKPVEGIEDEYFYSAPPAPVSVPDFDTLRLLFETSERESDHGFNLHKCGIGYADDATQARWEAWIACRAAMLQGAEPVTTDCKLPAYTPCKDAPEHIWLQTAGVWPENGEFSELTWCSDNQHPDDTLYVRADVVGGNSPVISDGWVLVLVEPTEDMIVNGFESEPDESFSDERDWEAYDAMSGCQQAAHRAKLCWAAMIAASPAYKKS